MTSRSLMPSVLVLTAVSLVGMTALGTPPGAADTGEQVVAWLRDHHDGVRWYVLSATLSAPLFAFVIAQLKRLLPVPHRDVFLIGGVALVAAIAAQSWFWGGLALHADRVEPATARTVLDVAVFFGPVLTGAWMTMIAPVTLAAFRGSTLPRWLGALGAIAFAEQAIETLTIFGSMGFTEPGGGMNMQLGAGLVGTWLLAFALWAGLRGVSEARGTVIQKGGMA